MTHYVGPYRWFSMTGNQKKSWWCLKFADHDIHIPNRGKTCPPFHRGMGCRCHFCHDTITFKNGQVMRFAWRWYCLCTSLSDYKVFSVKMYHVGLFRHSLKVYFGIASTFSLRAIRFPLNIFRLQNISLLVWIDNRFWHILYCSDIDNTNVVIRAATLLVGSWNFKHCPASFNQRKRPLFVSVEHGE